MALKDLSFFERMLRSRFYAHRDTRYCSTPDRNLRILVRDQIPTSKDGADAGLELETRQWIRDFYSRTIVAWIALIISVLALGISIVSVFLDRNNEPKIKEEKESHKAYSEDYTE
ncbi:hypothetical protein QEH59_18150 [Coraliomargarita sp. SDUM461004]|uniref:Uncharacterized protein n=1 Tax=Thalassobacterium sedimentorum TaxID=3041258 RepID=A0ABU1ARX5_9BACT|nr:hypothetical protein [Coraliomargarita sp. SDUM461004]MDQ8196358.1 hypothetical protein [Coraliomargarita sp. SDUM461004]